MVYLEVIKSSDPLALGLYEFEFDQISMGRSRKNDLIFKDRELPLQFLTIKFLQGQLVIQSITRSPYFFINGKKISGILKLKVGDVIAFGENQIRIVKAAVTNETADFSAAYEEFNKKAPELKFSLDFIEQILIDLERESNV
ncbi:MAG: FHA domain-containing protein [Bacteriovorax sp.]|jgi:pSer/pThr/pTyr-binding forkhead associated (FHA) protein